MKRCKILLPQNCVPGKFFAGGTGARVIVSLSIRTHAAESAAPEAEMIFAERVTEITIDDASEAG